MLNFINYLLNGISLGCIYALIAVGYTMVYGIIKLINFAHGEFYMFGAYISFYVLLALGGGKFVEGEFDANGHDMGYLALLLAMLCAAFATGLLAVIVERIVYRPLRKSGRIVALLAALGVSLFLQNAGQETVGAKDRTFIRTIPNQRYPRWTIEHQDIHAGDTAASDIAIVYTRQEENGQFTLTDIVATRGNPITERALKRMNRILETAKKSNLEATIYAYPAITFSNRQALIVLALLVTAAALYFLVQHTRFGRAMRAVSHDFEAAALMGINVNHVVAGTFFIGAFVAGIGGTLAGGMYYNSIKPLMGLMPGLKAFVAAVIGGIGSIPGALLGGILLGISENLVQAYFSSLYSDAFTFSLLIVVLLIRPSGLMGRPPSDKV
jgi:branched-chain amino acid transport system permease protein